MKKYNVSLASLLLFFATGAAIAMQGKSLQVMLENRSTLPINVLITYDSGKGKDIMFKLKGGALTPIKQANDIKNIQVEDFMSALSGGLSKFSKYSGELFKIMVGFYRNNYYKMNVQATVVVQDDLSINIEWADMDNNGAPMANVLTATTFREQ